MKKFNYQARDRATNKMIKATIQAESETSAANLLISQGFIPLIIEEAGSRSIIDKINGRITTKDRVVFTRQLATLLGAGLPLTQSLRTVLEQTENKRFKGIIEEIVSSIEGGKSLSDAFSKRPDVFDGVFLSLISAGEASGTLDDSLKRLADQQEKDAATTSKIKGALTYPIIVLFVIFGVMGFMLFTVVPQVENLYADLNKKLPFITQVMVSTAAFLASYWWLAIIVLGVGVYFIVQYLKTEPGIELKDRIKLHVPLFGQMFRKLYMARFARTAQTLLSTGVSMLDMLRITSEAVNNRFIARAIQRAAEKVKSGKELSASLKTEDYILELVPQMIKIGEQSGKIDEMLGRTAAIYESELDDEIKTISTAIEPVLMVVLAVIAGGMVGAILIPIYGLVNGTGL